MMGWRTPICDGCRKQDPVTVMLKDELWLKIAPYPDKRVGSGVLCFWCIQIKLGRLLTLGDLKPCVVTDEMLLGAYIAAQSSPDTPMETVTLGFHPERRTRPLEET